MKILWIEDDYYNLYEMMTPLRNSGYEITTASNSEQAINLIENNIFDMIILDIILRTKDIKRDIHPYPGLSLLETLKSDHNVNIPVIAFTVVEDPLLREKLKKLNVRNIMIKGVILPAQLKRAVDIIFHKE
jgi:CheY-like chemotaxis protein